MDFEQEIRLMAAEALFDAAQNSRSERLHLAKSNAIEEVAARCNVYSRYGYDPKLVRAVLEKKLKLISAAATCKALEKIKKPSAPHYTGGGFATDETWVPEEELIQWSLASLRAPLPAYALDRYLDLFRQIMGIDIMKRCGLYEEERT